MADAFGGSQEGIAMISLPEARTDARAARAQMANGLEELRHRLSPTELAADGLAMLDRALTFLGVPQARIDRNPLFAAVVLAGACWLFSSAPQAGGKSTGRARHRSRMLRRALKGTFNRKGDIP